ncbi:hypothetical protein VTO42DRAFT_1478 [Malbranchea cinnamomea]
MSAEAEVVLVPQGSVSQPTLEKLCKRFRAARLRALREYPSAFSSTYETESLFEDEVWLKRLQNPDSKTFVAICPFPSLDIDESTGNNDDTELKLIENEWIGMIVVLGPKVLAAESLGSVACWKAFTAPRQSSPTASEVENKEVGDFAVSMFVLPEMRGQGLGGKLIEASLNLVRREAASFKASRANVSLCVEAENHAAIKCYERCGFEFLPDDPTLEEFTTIHGAKVVGMCRTLELPSGSSSFESDN